MHLSYYYPFPVIGGCEVEFNGFITAANNLFIQRYNADIFANTFTPPRQVVQKSYSCPNDVTIQYAYFEVKPLINPCDTERDKFWNDNSYFRNNIQYLPNSAASITSYLAAFPPSFNFRVNFRVARQLRTCTTDPTYTYYHYIVANRNFIPDGFEVVPFDPA